MTSLWPSRLLLSILTVLALASWNDPARAAQAGAPKPVSAERTSFEAVTAQLDPGGSLFVYLGTEQWLQGLSGKIMELKNLLTSIPDVDQTGKTGIEQGLRALSRLVKNSGLEQISGVGASGILLEKGLYRVRSVVHHYPGKGDGFGWSLFGSKPHPLDTLNLLPASSGFVVSSDLDLPLAWKIINDEVQSSDARQAIAPSLQQFREMIEGQTGMDLEKFLGSISGPFTMLFTLDDTRKVSIPLPQGPTEIPEPALALIIKVADTTLFDTLEKTIPEEAGITRVDKPGLKIRSMALPLPLPIPLVATLAAVDGYVILATQPRLVEEMLAVKQGQDSGLKGTREFQWLSDGLPLEGNQVAFMSYRVSEVFKQVVTKVMESTQKGAGNSPEAALMNSFSGEPQYGLSIATQTETGWSIVSQGNQDPATFGLATAVAPAAIAAGMLLPALAKAKARAQSVSCMSNMKQIGLAARIYANDHNDELPPTFLAMKDELVSPKVLVCPGDSNKARPTDWSGFNPDEITYEYVSPDASLDDPDQIVFRCPIHGHVGHADGSVRSKPRQ